MLCYGQLQVMLKLKSLIYMHINTLSFTHVSAINNSMWNAVKMSQMITLQEYTFIFIIIASFLYINLLLATKAPVLLEWTNWAMNSGFSLVNTKKDIIFFLKIEDFWRLFINLLKHFFKHRLFHVIYYSKEQQENY